MRNRTKSSENKLVEMSDLYAFRAGALWSALKSEPLSFWSLCFYFFFEYVRPQTLYPVIDVLPFAQIFLVASVVLAFMDGSVTWVKNIENKWLVYLSIIIVLSGMFAFRPSASLDYWVVMGGWVIVTF